MKQVFIAVILVAVLSGCGTDKEFNNLISQAKTHYNNKDIVSAREVYEKALELKEDIDTRNAYKKVMSDIEMAKDVTAFRDRLREMQTDIKTTFDTVELTNLLNSVFDLTTEIQTFKPDTQYYSGLYLSKVKSSSELDNLRTVSVLNSTSVITGKTEISIAQKTVADAISKLLDFDDYPYDNIK